MNRALLHHDVDLWRLSTTPGGPTARRITRLSGPWPIASSPSCTAAPATARS